MANGTKEAEPILDPKDAEINLLRTQNAELRTRNSDIEHKNATLGERNGVLSKRRDEDAVRKEAAELNVAKGTLEAKLMIAEKKAALLEGELKDERTDRTNEAKLLKEKLGSLGKQGEEFKNSRDKAQILLRQNQIVLAGKTWGPWITAGGISLLMFFLCYQGIIIPRTGDPKQDTMLVMNQIMQIEQGERTRQAELQKPQEVWGVTKGRSNDGKAILTFIVYMDERQQKMKKSEIEFVSSTILAALRYKTVVAGGGTSDANNQEYLAMTGGTNQPVIWPSSLNDMLGEAGLEEIRLKLPEFSFGINMEFLDATVEQNHYKSYGAEFKKGRFRDPNENNNYIPSVPVPGKG